MNPRLYRHRINTVEALASVSFAHGIELDLRSSGDEVLVTHDPFTTGPTIEQFFPLIGPRPCIFNIKTEGIEQRVRHLAQVHGIEDYFFLDCSVPAMVKLARSGESRLAVRYSELEPIEAVWPWAGLAQWVWIDCFSNYPGDSEAWRSLGERFRLCVVGPELQAHDEPTQARLLDDLRDRPFHAVCSKRLDRWHTG